MGYKKRETQNEVREQTTTKIIWNPISSDTLSQIEKSTRCLSPQLSSLLACSSLAYENIKIWNTLKGEDTGFRVHITQI